MKDQELRIVPGAFHELGIKLSYQREERKIFDNRDLYLFNDVSDNKKY